MQTAANHSERTVNRHHGNKQHAARINGPANL